MSQRNSNPNSIVNAPEKHTGARLKQIRDAQEQARREIVKAKATTTGGVSRRQLATARAAVQGLLLEIEPLLQKDVFVDSAYYLNDVRLGAVSTDREQVEVVGLMTLIEQNGVRVETEQDVPGAGGGTKPVTTTRPFPLSVLVNAFRCATQFLQDNELGVEIDQSGGEAELPYSDIIPGHGDDE